jgi:hypothetical protein
MDSSKAARDPFDLLAEEFALRVRRGEQPSPSEYADRHLELAEAIRRDFPTIALMEGLKAGGDGAEVSSPDDAEPARRAIPNRPGEYRIVREIGRGGMGVVYETEQEPLGHRVALKVLPFQPTSGPVRLLRFVREARAAARLHHTNIVPVFDVRRCGDVHYYAMQFIEGQGLDEAFDELRRIRGGAMDPVDGRPDREPAFGDGPRPLATLATSLATGLLEGRLGLPDDPPVATKPGPITAADGDVSRPDEWSRPGRSRCPPTRHGPATPGSPDRSDVATITRWRGSGSRRPRHWPTRTPTGSSIGTSSRPTCCLTSRGRSG